MKGRYARGIVVICSIVLLLTGTFLFSGHMAGSIRLSQDRRWKAEDGQIFAEVSFGIFRKERVRLWWNEEKNKYNLFLPSFWQEDTAVTLLSASKEELMLDGKKVDAFGKVKGLKAGMHELSVGGQTYSLEVMASENIPALFIDMENEKMDALYEIPYTEQYGADMLLVCADGSIEQESSIEEFRVRGNTSADWPKKPYQMTMSQTVDFFGMGSALKWNLLSNWSDATLLRNRVAYSMADGAGMPYSPDSTFVDLYLNGEYQGNYQLCEKIEIGANRVDIRNLENYTDYEPKPEELDMETRADLAKENPEAAGITILENGVQYRGYETRLGTEDITGGYLLEIERPSRIYGSPSFFITAKGQPVTVKRPKYVDVSEVAYIAAVWQTFEDALYAEDGKNPGTGLHYTEYIEKDSFVKKYLIEEIVRNYDASSTSQYFYKDADSTDKRLYAGPAWDYDMSLGNPKMNPKTNQNYISSVSPYGLFAALPMDEFTLWYHLYEKEDFREAAKAVYEEAFLPQLKELVDGGIDSYADEIEKSALMDGERWDLNNGTDEASRTEKYREKVDILKNFVGIREHYLTGLWVDGRESKKVYLDGGNADMYISYVETLVGDVLEEPLAPVMEGYTFVQWLNGYTKEPFDFTQPYDGSDLYFVAEYRSDADGSTLIAGEE